MVCVTALFAFSTTCALCFDRIRNAIPNGLLFVWFVTAIALTEITVIDSLRNERIRKKVSFALVIQFIPILPLLGYWWWKSVGNGAGLPSRVPHKR